MRLLITTQVLDRDDAGYFGFFHEWIKEFAKYCDKIVVICLKEGAHELPSNVLVYSLGKERGRPALGSLSYGLRFFGLSWRLRREYDAVFVHMNPEYIVLCGWLWRLWHKKIVLWYLHRNVDLKLRVAEWFVNRVLTASPESFRLKSNKVSVVGHGIDPIFAPANKIPNETLRIIYWGRLSPSKRIKEMIDAVARLQTQGTKAALTIIGAAARPSDETYIAELKKQAQSVGGVTFVGGIPHRDVPKYLKNADVCINISETQSMDKTVLEAMAAGLPVVSSNDSYKDVLSPYGLWTNDVSPQTLAEMLLRAAKVDPAPLVDYVRREHSLESLVPKIVVVLKS